MKTQTWIATSGYVLVAILTKDLSLDWGFGEILRILGMPPSRGVPGAQLLTTLPVQDDTLALRNRLPLFDLWLDSSDFGCEFLTGG